MAFHNNRGVKDDWNKSVTTLLKQTDVQKRGELKIGLALPSAMESIVGEGGAGLKVSGYRRIAFSGRSQWMDAKSTGAVRQSKFPSLNMEQLSRFTVEGTVGSKITVQVDQDSKRTTDLENRIILRYKGDDDDVLQSVDLGNTTLTLGDSRFIGYSQQIQGLFGIGAAGKVGPVDFKVIASQEKGNTARNRLTAGANEQSIIIRDFNYDRFRFFDLAKVGYKVGDSVVDSVYWKPGDRIVWFDLYISGWSTDPSLLQEVAYRDWRHPNRASADDSITQSFRRLNANTDYVVNTSNFFVYFPRKLQNIEDNTLAYFMVVLRADGTTEMFGDTTNTTPGIPTHLQLLKRQRPLPDDPLLTAEWRNVYDLGIRNVNYEDVNIDIFRGQLGDEDNAANLDHQGGKRYLELFGMDRYGPTAGSPPDGKIDDDRSILDLDNGLLIFPNRHPFDTTALDVRVPELYTSTNRNNMRDSSKYYVKIVTRQRSRMVSLGNIDILEGSEVVTLNNNRLIKGVGYDIDYQSGQVTFLTDEALDKNAQVTIDYEYNPFISAEKRSLFGFALRYGPGANFRTGTTVLYKGTKATDRPAQLGQEPYRDLVAEQFVNWTAEPHFLTSLVDALPLIKTSAPSRIDFQGALARSLPNPNTRGEVFIDDFEGAKRAQSLSVLRESWSLAAPPLKNASGDVLNYRSFRYRGPSRDSSRTIDTVVTYLNDPAFLWFNPYDPFDRADIYDLNTEGTTAADRRTHVLVLEFRPQASLTRTDTATGGLAPSTAAWGGVSRALPTSNWDQSRTEYVELRVAVSKRGSAPGALKLDLGRISEDLNGNRKLDTEDKERGDPPFRNGILDPDEDVGVDTIPDSLELGPKGWFDAVANPDPAGDNFSYDGANPATRNYYDHINGTEKNNLRDPVVGAYPNTEKLSRDSPELELVNAYFEFSIDLGSNSDPWLVQGSERSSRDVTGFAGPGGDVLVWRTYRIPVENGVPVGSSVVGSAKPDWNYIRAARLWMSGADSTTRVYIAAVDLIERTWKAERPSAAAAGTSFDLGVVNTEENGRTYRPPPGVSGFKNAQGVTEKEQSLLLKYKEFRADDTGRAIYTLPSKEDYTGYRFLRMWVHADRSANRTALMYMRFGQNQNNYYEYRDTLRFEDSYEGDPDANWRANAIAVDFNQLTAVKDTVINETGWKSDSAYYDPVAKVGFKGRPSLATISFREIGLVCIANRDTLPISGEIWCDELRLTDVRKDPGTAASVRVNVGMADLLGFTFSLEGQNYAFRQLTQGRSVSVLAGSDRLKASWNGNISLEKFFPSSLGLSLPLSVNYSKDVSTPRLLTGSDIVLTADRQAQQRSTSTAEGFSVRPQLQPKSRNWLINATVGALKTSFSANRSKQITPVNPYSYAETYSANADYNLQFQQRLSFPAFFWTRFFLLPKRVSRTPLSLLPTSFKATGAVTRTRATSINSSLSRTDSYTRTFTGSSGFSLKPIPAITVNYDMTTQRDLSNPEHLVLEFDPRRFRLGDEVQFTQRVGSNYAPTLFSFFSPTFTYSGNFTDRIGRFYGNHDVSGDRTWSVGGTFDPTKFWLALGARPVKPRQRAPATPKQGVQPISPKQRAVDSANALHPKPADNGEFAVVQAWRAMLGGLRWVTSPIGAMGVNYARSDNDVRNGQRTRPSRLYQLGLSLDEPEDSLPGGAGSALTRVRTHGSRESFGVKNQLNVLGLLTFGSSYTLNNTETKTEGSITRAQGVSFPNLTTQMTRLERIIPLRWFFSSANAYFSFERKIDKSFQANSLLSTTTSNNFSPLLKISGVMRKGVTMSFTMSRRTDLSEPRVAATHTKTTDNGIEVGSTYSFSSPRGIPLPILRGLRLRSQMTLTVTVTSSNHNTYSKAVRIDTTGGGSQTSGYQLSQQSGRFSVRGQASYSFSTRLQGGTNFEWTDRSDLSVTSGKTKSHERVLGIWAEFRF